MQFQVPQYLDVEDKIFGQFTLKQVVYSAGGIGLSYLVFKALPLLIALPIIVGICVFAFMLGFTPVDKFGKPFESIVESAFKFAMKPRLYTWKHEPKKKKPTETKKTDENQSSLNVGVPTVSESKLKDLSWNLDVAQEENQ